MDKYKKASEYLYNIMEKGNIRSDEEQEMFEIALEVLNEVKRGKKIYEFGLDKSVRNYGRTFKDKDGTIWRFNGNDLENQDNYKILTDVCDLSTILSMTFEEIEEEQEEWD